METEKILKAMANRRRLAMIKLLDKGHLPVMGIAQALRLSVRATSKHLQILAKADIVDYTQISLERHYRLTEPRHPLIVTALLLA